MLVPALIVYCGLLHYLAEGPALDVSLLQASEIYSERDGAHPSLTCNFQTQDTDL